MHKTIETFNDMNGQRHFDREKPEMPDEYYKERPVERQSCKPEPFSGAVSDLWPMPHFSFYIPEKRPETEHFQRHTADDPEHARRTFEFVLFDPWE